MAKSPYRLVPGSPETWLDEQGNPAPPEFYRERALKYAKKYLRKKPGRPQLRPGQKSQAEQDRGEFANIWPAAGPEPAPFRKWLSRVT